MEKRILEALRDAPEGGEGTGHGGAVAGNGLHRSPGNLESVGVPTGPAVGGISFSR